MITPALRWLSRLDRSYFFAISSLISAIVVSLVFAVTLVLATLDDSDTSLSDLGAGVALALIILPLFIAAVPLISLPRHPAPIGRNHKVNGVGTTLLLFGFIVVTIDVFGLYYGPSLIFSISSSIALFFGRKRKLVQQELTGRPRGEDGIRLSRGGLKRLREQERIAAEADASDDDGPEPQGESPLESSRRRRGRNRRKR